MSNCVIRISADSTCDLSPQLLEQYGIETLPLYVIYDGVEYKDGVDLTPDQLYEKVRQGGKLGSTAAINVDDYLGFFSRLRESCDTVIHFTISSEMSSCCQNARIAAQEVGGVYVIDSRNLSTGIGLQMLLYLFALEQSGEAVVGAGAVAAGVQYFPARVPLLSADGCCPLPLHCTSILTSPVTAIWPSVWARSLASTSLRTSTTPICPSRWQSSGAVGI